MGVSRSLAGAVVLTVVSLCVVGCSGVNGLLDDGPAPSALADASAVERPPGVPADAEPAIVDRVVDGDTVRVIAEPGGTIAEGGSIRVRLLNIDAPEVARDDRPAQCLADEAAARLTTLLPATSLVWLAADREERDQYDRPLRGLWTDDGVFANELLVEEGLAEAVLFPPNDRFHAPIVAAERRAAAARVGLHGVACR